MAATAKRDLAEGELLDGEGGETVWGRLLPAALARAEDALPIGLAHGVRLRRRIAAEPASAARMSSWTRRIRSYSSART